MDDERSAFNKNPALGFFVLLLRLILKKQLKYGYYLYMLNICNNIATICFFSIFGFQNY